MQRYFHTALIVVLVYGCTGSIKNLNLSRGEEEIRCCGEVYRETLQIKYLGVAGFLMRRGDHAVLTAPFYSNPGFIRIGLILPISPNRKRIERLLPPVDDVDAILVGHSHYDHLMDVPYIANKRAKRAKVYGSKTMTHILAPEISPNRLVALNEKSADSLTVGKWTWVADSTIRFMAVISEHAPHFHGIKFYGGKIKKNKSKLPKTVWGWKEGQTFAYVIDFMGNDKKTIDYRIHFQDSASTPPFGFPPPFKAGEAKYADIAILCMASFHEVKNYPEGIIKHSNPKNVIIGHWEDFFRSPEKPLRVVRLTNAGKFIEKLKDVLPPGSDWFMPEPGAWLRFQK